MALISLRNISKRYMVGSLESIILDNVSIDVEYGEMLAIVGASGSGKSTLMNIIGFLDKADSGSHFMQNKNVSNLSEDELAHNRNQYIGFVFQQFHLLPRLNVLQNVSLPLSYRNLSLKDMDEQSTNILKRVAMDSFVNRLPSQLSGGQQQRVAIARALVGNPQVILADEPTGSLDSKTSNSIMDLFLSLHAEGRTIIIVTHDEHIANQCSRKITIDDGKISQELSL